MKNQRREIDAALDLRAFLERLDGTNELRVITGAHWDLEIGALSEIFAESSGSPALLFDDIEEYPRGYRVLSNILFSPRREALALGVSPDLRRIELVKWAKSRLEKFEPIPPTEIKDAPVLQNVVAGDDVNILKFPTPKWHELDGGRYIGTFDAVVCRDPDTGYVNIGTYRIQVHDERTVGLYMVPGKHGDLIARKYWSKGEACPFVIACGVPPSMVAASALGVPWTVSEYDFLGGLLGEPFPVVKSPVTGLPMPAFAEIVLEGSAPPPDQTARLEGPFGEWPGYYSYDAQPAPIVKIDTIYHRDDPIITGDPPVKTYMNSQIYMYTRAANIWSTLERAGVPDVQGVWFPNQGRFVVVVSIRQRFAGHAREAGYGVLATRDGGRDPRMVIVVDDDIDITNINEVLWAVCSRWDPKTASEIVEVAASALNPRIPPEKKNRNELTSSCILIDACKPFSWMKDYPPVSAFSSAQKQQVMAKWSHLFSAK
jgi:4-hydroxy-3-polyprenylbenzoate decarboxylase